MLLEINTNPKEEWDATQAIAKLKSIVTTLIEDVQLSDNNYLVQTEEERRKILAKARRESEIEKIVIEAREIQKLKEELQNDRERLLAQEEKFNFFKAKLEVADKELDFQMQAQGNKSAALIWAILAGGLL